ncbi:hypothetical protein [Ferruginibacter sp.]|nr:hypothetical protein [Ferruginibacter sp.]
MKEKANAISKLIELSKEKHTYRHSDLKAMQADNDWAAAHLLSKLFFESEIIPNTYISFEQLNAIRKEFESKEEVIDIEILIKKFWIRIICGLVQVPTGIISASSQYEKLKDAEVEFNFLVEAALKFKENTPVEKSLFLEFVSEYQSKKGEVISLEKCKAIHLMEEKDETIRIYNINYNKPIFQYKDDLKFIGFLLEKQKQGDHYKLTIQREVLESIYTLHKSLFSETPTLEELIVQKVIVKNGTDYFLQLWSCEPDYWTTFGNKIGALLWELMKQSYMYAADGNLVRQWILKMQFIDAFIKSLDLIKFEDKKLILNSCYEILIDDNDLFGLDTEISKLVLSNRRSEYVIITNSPKIGFPDLTKAKNIFELFNLMEESNEVHQSDLLWMQESRWFIDKLIQTIVFYDDSEAGEDLKYSKIRRLLVEGFSRPYLLWRVCFFIYYWRPEIIPYLCLDENLSSLGFNLYFNTQKDRLFSEAIATDIKREIFYDNFNLVLSGLRNSHKLTNSEKAVKVFECLLIISENKWQFYRDTPTQQVLIERENLKRTFTGLVEVFKIKKLQGSYFGPTGEIHKYFFSTILTELFEIVKNYTSNRTYPDGVIGLSLVKMELLDLLFEMVISENYQQQKEEVQELEERAIVNQFLSEYCKVFNTKSVTQWSYQDAQMADVTPLWSNNQKGVELIPWEKWALYLEQFDLLPAFLMPSELKLKSTEDKWDKYNHFTIDKIRKHLEILILIHQRLRLKEFVYKQQGFKIDIVLSRIERSITDFITKYSIDDTLNASIDIFDDRHERTVFGSEENALIPILAQALNKFETLNKEEILKSLIKTSSLTKCLKLLEFLSSEADIAFIKKQIVGFDVSQYLDEKKYIPEIEKVVVKLSEFEEFVDKAKEALHFWQEKILTQRDNTEYLITYFRIKLIIAYYEGDENAIISEHAPPVDSFSTSKGFEFIAAETRDFYLGLVKLKNNDPESAYFIFNRLINSSKNDTSTIANNRFYSHIKLAETKKNLEEKDKCFSDAIIEWDAYENSIPIAERAFELEYTQENVWLNKLNVYHELQRNIDFDRLFNSLDRTYQLRKDFFEIRVNNSVKRGQYELAKQFVNEANGYHQSKDDTIPEFIRSAIEKLENEEDYKRLRHQYRDLISRSPEKLVLILPDNIVGKRNIHDYVLKQICNSVNNILDIINSIEKINNEDKYTDLLILCLQSRLRSWYWQIGNTRGGFSGSNKRNSGELDFVIDSADGERIATCEALLIHGKNTSTVTTHAIKTFNYDHRRKLFFILAYYSGTDFINHWVDYKTNIIPGITFPVGFPLLEKVEEINESFTNNSIRVLLAKHGNDLKVYHVFININYKLATP